MSDILLPPRGDLAPEIADANANWKSLRVEEQDLTAFRALREGQRLEAKFPGYRSEGNRRFLQSYKDRRLSRGEKPFQYLEKAQRRERDRQFRERLPFFNDLFAGTDKFDQAFPESHRAAVAERFASSMNPARDKMQTANLMLVSEMTGKPVGELEKLWPQFRSQYAQQVLGAQGPVDDAAFYSLAGKKLAGEKADGELAEKIADKVQQMAISTRPLAEAMEEGKKLAGDRWKEFQPAARAAYAGVLADFDDDTLQTARELFEIAAKGEGKDVEQVAGEGLAFLNYAKMVPGKREQVLGLLALQAKAEGEDVEGYFRRVGAAMSSGMSMLVGGAVSRGNRVEAEAIRKLIERGTLPDDVTSVATMDAAAVLKRMEHSDRLHGNAKAAERGFLVKARPMTDIEKEMLEGFVSINEGQAAFVQDLAGAGVKVQRFMGDQSRKWWMRADDFTLMAAESLPVMGAAALPYGVGLPLVISSYGERNLADFRRQMPDADQGTLERTAYAAGILEAGIDRLQWFTLGARVPKLNAALLKWHKPGAVGVGLVRAGIVGLEQSGQEVVQDLTAPAVQELAAALSADIKGPNWTEVIERERQALGDIFGVSMVFGLIGGAGSTVVDVMQAPKLKAALTDRQGLALAGYAVETVDAIAKTAETNPAAAAEMLKAAAIETPVEVRKANSERARAIIEQAAQDASTAEDALIPEIEKRPDGGYQVRYPDGRVDPAISESDALDAVRMWEAGDLNRMEVANRTLARELESTHADNPELGVNFRFTGKQVSMKTWAGDNAQRIEVARHRVRIAMRDDFLAGEIATDGREIADADLPLDAYLILGTSQNFGGAVTRIAAEIHKHGNVATVLEEHSEGVLKWVIASGRMSEADVIRGIRETEAATGKQTLPDDLSGLAPEAAQRAIVEAWSRLAVANAFGKIAESSLSAKFKALFRALKEAFSAVLSLAGQIREIQLAGQMDEQFEYWLDVAGGVSDAYQMENLQKAAERELQEAAFEGFPEISTTLKGKLPRHETLRQQGAAFAGEIERLYDGLRNSSANGASVAARTRVANEFFLPVGEMADLDQLRIAANAKGFAFDTPGDMIDALDLSVNYGRPQYGVGAATESFSIGRTEVMPNERTRIFRGADGSPSVIGPASFSIRAFHGTPHKVDRFTTDKMGTGEGAQAYGWGLYFAQAEEVAREYRRVLGQEFRVDGEILMRSGNVGPKFAELKAAVGPDAADIVIAYLDRGIQRVYDELRHPHNDFSDEVIGETLDFLDRIESADSGNVYKVTLKVDDEALLDWDKTLPEQSAIVRSAIGFTDDADGELRDMTGGEWYRDQTNAWAVTTAIDPETLSKKLLAAGVRGVRFLDGNSRGEFSVRGAGDYYSVVNDNGHKVGEFDSYEAAKAEADELNGGRTRNYVIFDEADIEILEENGQPVDSGGGVSFSLGRADGPAIIKSQLHESHLARTGTGEPSQGEGSREAESRRRISETLAGGNGGYGERYVGDGTESVVVSFDEGRVLKEIKRAGVNRYSRDGGYSFEYSFEAAAEKAHVINALGGMPTSAFEAEGRIFLLQDEGTPITQSEYEALVLPGNIVPASGNVFRIEIEGRHYLVSDLHRQNFMKDAAGVIRLIDAVVGEVTAQTSSLREVSTTSLAAVRADSPLLKAIETLAKGPEATATVFKQMRVKVGQVRERLDKNRRESGFSEEELDPERFERLRDIATLEAIAKALPQPIRGKLVGSFARLEDFKTTKGRESYLVKLLPKIEGALEQHLQTQYRAAIRREMQRGAVKVSEAKTRGGKIGATGHMIFDQAKAAMKMDATAAEAEAAKLQDQIDGAESLTMEQLAELDARLSAVELFHDYENASATRLEKGLELLKDTYREGRKAWLETLMDRRILREQRIFLFKRGLGLTTFDAEGNERDVFITDAMRNAAQNRDRGAKFLADEAIMAAGLSGSQKLRRLWEMSDDPTVKLAVEAMEDAFHFAETNEADMNLADNAALAQALRDILKASNVWSVSRRLNELSTPHGAAPVEKIEGRSKEQVSVPINVVESLLAGEVGGFADANGKRVELDAHDLEALQESWDRFQDLQEEEQAKRRVIQFERIHADGERRTIGEVSQLQGLMLYLTMRQPDQAKKLERLGYDEQTLAQLETWLKPEVKELGAWMVDFLGADSFTVDALHRAEKGVALPLVENYFPVRNDVSGSDASGLSLDGAGQQQSGRSVSFIKERVANNAPPAYVNALAVFTAHRAQANFWKSHVTAIREWGGVIKDERFSAAVKYSMGNAYYQSLSRLLDRIESGGALAAKQQLGVERMVRTLTRNFALGTLGLRMSTLMVNTTAVLNAGTEIPAGDLIKGLLQVVKRPEAFADAWKSPAIQRRLKAGGTFEAQLAKTNGPIAGGVKASLQWAAEKGVAPINIIDTSANLLGAAVVWEHARSKASRAGLPDDQARAEADRAVERLFLRAAQPTSRLAKSELEMRALDNPLSALFLMFVSEPRKALAISYMAGREIITGKGTYGKPMAAQQLAVTLLAMGAATYMVRSLAAAWFKAKDDEEDELFSRFWRKMTDGKAWGHALATSHLQSVPLLGEIWNQLSAKAFDQKAFPASSNILNQGTGKAVKWIETLGEEKTARDTVEGGIDLMQGLGTVVPGGALLAQLGNAAEFVEGAVHSAGVDLSPEDRRARFKARYSKFGKELEAIHGKTTGEDGKIRKGVQAAKWTARADWLRTNLATLPEAEREKFLEEINAGVELRKLMKAK